VLHCDEVDTVSEFTVLRTHGPHLHVVLPCVITSSYKLNTIFQPKHECVLKCGHQQCTGSWSI